MGAMRSRTVRVVAVALSVVMALLIPFLVPAAALAREDADVLAAQADDIASGEGWRLTSEGQLVIFGAVPYWYTTNTPWYRYSKRILSAVALEGASVSTCHGMFSGCSSLASLDLSGLDTSSVADMGSMFSGCSSLSSLDLSGLDTASVTGGGSVLGGMSGMFWGCSNLSSLDLSGWDTSSVTDMANMFQNCSNLSSLDLSGFDTSSVTDMHFMFCDCSSLSSLDLSGLDTSAATDMSGMFQNCSNLSSLDLSGFDTSAVKDMGSMFYNCYNLSTLDISGWDTSALTRMYNMFYNCQKLAAIRAEGLRLGSIGISFTGAGALESLEGTASWDTSAVTSMPSMFRRCCNLTSLDLSGWDTSHVTDMRFMFEDCNNLSSLDLTGWDTSSVTYMNEMFSYCWSLSSLDLTGWDTSHVTSMYRMFHVCSQLTSLDLSGFDTSAVKDMGSMFYNCSNLSSLDLSGWDISSVTDDITDMFSGCQKLAKIRAEGLRLGSIGVSFSDLSALESVEGTSSWDTSAVKDMSSMFYNCYNLSSLDLSGWDTSSVTGMSAMFWGCSKLKTIVVSDLWSVEGVKYDDRVFEGCTSLVGGRGTRYSPDHTDKEYARVDAEGAPGYLTFGEGPGPGHVPFEVVDSVPITDARFTFRSGVSPTDEMESLISYDDRWVFSTDERDTYSLMRASIRVAMAAFGTVGDGSPKYIEALMDTLGFDYTKDSVHYPRPTQETIGYAIGMRNVRLADGSERSVVLVAIRGGGYGREWGGNFRVGNEPVHEGFGDAAEEVRSGLMAFLQAHEDDLCARVAVWACGYSRAAATTNLLAQKLISGVNINAYGIGERDVRAFCFECPQNIAVGGDVAGAGRYDNIVSVVNPIDFVPKVAPSGWGFTRYGRTYYTPSRETSWKYDRKKTAMMLAYEGLLESNGLGYSDELHAECVGQAYRLDAIVHAVTVISRDYYQRKLQDGLCNLAADALGGNGGYKDSDNMTERVGAFVDGCASLDPRMWLAIKGGMAGKGAVPGENLDAVAFANFKQAHYPELCLSWVDSLGSLDAFETSTTNKYVRLVVNCPVDVTVRDSAGEVVGSIVGDVPGEGDRVVTLVDSDGQKVVVLPMDERFSLELEATDAGEVTYTAIEFDADACANERVVAYEEVAVERGDVLVGGMEDGDGGVEYTLTGPGGEALEPDLEAQGDGVREFLVEAGAAEGGSAEGGGTYVQDTFCLLTATPDEGWEFDGWYAGGELVAEEPELRLRVTADATLEARFVEAPGPFFLDADPADDANHGAEVDWMGKSGISEGWAADGGRVYNGLWNVKRCDFAAFLYRMADLTDDGERNDSCAPTDEEVAAALAGVSDCDASTAHSMEVAWLVGTGISRGWDNGDGTVSFRPMSDIKRQDMAAFLHRFADLTDDGEMNGSPEMGDQQLRFSDVAHGDEANHASDVEWLASVGVTRGWDNHDGTYSFGGLRDIVRQDMAAFMKRLYDHMAA